MKCMCEHFFAPRYFLIAIPPKSCGGASPKSRASETVSGTKEDKLAVHCKNKACVIPRPINMYDFVQPMSHQSKGLPI
ncbi:MAG: hypothetical protein CL942_14870 [Desulfovibrio sp.]|nr:hypothetical protein [Desulfovibrio sp.]